MVSPLEGVLQHIALLAPIFFIIYTVRGFSRALAADIMGDPSARDDGFISLNPTAHIDVIKCLIMITLMSFLSIFIPDASNGQLLLVLILIGGAQWVYPVPINNRNFKNQSLGIFVTTLAGPIGTIFCALITMYLGSIIFKFHLSTQAMITAQQILFRLIDLSIYSALFDLLPIPPFEGARLLPLILPRVWLGAIEWLERYGPIVILMLFALPVVSDYFFYSLYIANKVIQSGLIKLVLI